MQPIELLAVLGRGIRQRDDQLWVPTRDLEMYGENFTQLAKQQPVDDADPHCLVGGGELNLLAGAMLYALHPKTLKAAVCAHGARSPYLSSVNAPSESEVMSGELRRLLGEAEDPEIVVWNRERLTEGPSNTNREIQNIFELAEERGFTEVGIVTVAVQYARALLMAQRHLMNLRFTHLTLQCYISEDVLLRHNPERFGPRIRAIHSSQAFMRTMFFEQRGINCLLAGNY